MLSPVYVAVECVLYLVYFIACFKFKDGTMYKEIGQKNN